MTITSESLQQWKLENGLGSITEAETPGFMSNPRLGHDLSEQHKIVRKLLSLVRSVISTLINKEADIFKSTEPYHQTLVKAAMKVQLLRRPSQVSL